MSAKLFIVGKQPHNRKRWPTTVLLTLEQRLALSNLQIERMIRGERKPTVTELVVEGLALLAKREKVRDFTK